MTRQVSNEIELIVSTLLQVGSHVLEISKDHVITGVWCADKSTTAEYRNNYVGKKILNVPQKAFISHCDARVTEGFKTRRNSYYEYEKKNGDTSITYSLRILLNHPDKDYLFIVAENLSDKEGFQLTEDKWKIALDVAGDGVWDINKENDEISFSEKWYELFGYSPGDIKTGTEWSEKIHPDDRVENQKEVDNCIEGITSSYISEIRCLCKDGNYKWIQSRGMVINRNPDGKALRFIGTHTDIEERKVIEKTIEEQRQFYEGLLNHIPADIAVFDAKHVYLFVNKNGFKNDELRRWMIGKTDWDYAKRSNRPDSFVIGRHALLDRAVSEKREVEWIEKLTTKDGETEYHLRIIHPVFYENGTHKYSLAYGLNITELIEAQEALKTSVETFSSAFEHSGVGMALISPFGHWLDMNNEVIRLTGYSKEELKQLTFQDITYSEDLEKDVNLVKQMLKKEITTYTIEKRYISKEKKIVWASLTVSMVWNSDDTPKFFIAQILDISQQKELELEINKRTAELESTKSSLINKVKQLEELSYIVAHNLRGAAGNIKAISGAMVARNKGGKYAAENPLSNAFTDEEAMAFIEESSISLMSSLSTLMKITEIKLNNQIPYNICNVATIINDITGQLHTMIYEKNAIIKLDIQLQQISYPKAYLENILYNLISNALKYTKDDVQPEILITTRIIDEGMVQIIVKDNGLGIDMKKYKNQVFKLNNVFHKGFDSKGVGLYITKTQVESMGGSIEVISKVNEGCEFIVTLSN